jgi:hypothetical protein
MTRKTRISFRRFGSLRPGGSSGNRGINREEPAPESTDTTGEREAIWQDRRSPSRERRQKNDFFKIPATGCRRGRRERRDHRSDFDGQRENWYLSSNSITVDFVDSD